MTQSMPQPGMPSVLRQLSVLPPTVKAVVGVAMLALGIAVVVMLGVSYFSLVVLTVLAMTGVPLAIQGVSQRAHGKVVQAELEQAREQLDLLRLEIDQAQADKRGVERLLMDRGFTTAEARRWIALECDVVLPRSSMP